MCRVRASPEGKRKPRGTVVLGLEMGCQILLAAAKNFVMRESFWVGQR